MARRGGEEEEDEHDQNPFLSISSSKASSSKLQFRKVVSRARWDEKIGMGEVVEKRGSMWTTTGIIRNGKLYCHIEDILFLAERGALHLVCSDDKVLSIGDMYKKIAEEKDGCSWETFDAYRCLKSLGYIIGRHGIPWTTKENKSLNSNFQQNISNTDETLDQDVENKISILLKGMQIDEIKPTFDVYLPNNKFKKSSPGDPVFLLCVLKGNPPLRQKVERLEGICGIPIKFCFVDHGKMASGDDFNMPRRFISSLFRKKNQLLEICVPHRTPPHSKRIPALSPTPTLLHHDSPPIRLLLSCMHELIKGMTLNSGLMIGHDA